MNITGLILRDTIKRWEIRRDSLKRQFEDVRYAFKDESKDSPLDLAQKICDVETNIVTLQVIQIKYNQSVKVASALLKRDVTIAEGVKLAGAYDRMAKLWSAQTDSGSSRYGYGGPPTRNSDQEVASEAVDLNGKLQQVEYYTKLSSHVRTLVAHGNNIPVEQDLTASLFDV